MARFTKLESFTFYIAVTADGAEYTEVLGLIALLVPTIRTITLAHYLHGQARNHTVPRQTLVESLRQNADELQRTLDPERFSGQTHVVLQFQGLHGSEEWWIKKLEPILPELFKAVHDFGGRYLSVENVTCKHLRISRCTAGAEPCPTR